MSFRKRNVGISANLKPGEKSSPPVAPKPTLPGVRPSTLDGRPVTSTGTAALDGLLAGHGGLALGSFVLIGESGTTDYAGALLKFFAAEGLLQGHHVHVVGLPAQWGRELPAVTEERKGKVANEHDKMKIAWRYQGLGELGSVATPRDRGLVRWMELLSDGVFELAPFPHTAVAITNNATTTDEDPPQGLLRIHKLPILHELGSGAQSYDDDWSFSLSRRRLAIKPFNLPPLDEDPGQPQPAATDPAAARPGKGHSSKAAKSDLEF
ncbi:hypothetical protein DV738_g4697, partial [Chaetothyriales sp. CBS 135597]